MQQTCPHCGALVRAGSRFCGTCGKAVPAPTATHAAAVPQAFAGPSMASPAAYLLAADGRRYPLSGQLTRIGRSSQCAVQIPDHSVSGVHAEIEASGGSYLLRDLGSSNGTFLNNIQVRGQAPLNSGDQVVFGNAVFTFQGGMPAQPAYAPAQPHAPAWPASPPVPAYAPAQPQAPAWPASPPVPAYSPAQPQAPAWPAPTPAPAAIQWGPQPSPQQLHAAPDWGKKPPELEGRVHHMDGPHQEKLSMMGPMAATGCMALLFTGCLAPLAPLAFLPMFGRREMTVYHLRIEESGSGAHRAVLLRGDPTSQISQGDTVAFWGRWNAGTLFTHKAYNYNTGAFVQVKKGLF